MTQQVRIRTSELVRKHLVPGAGRIAVEVVRANQEYVGSNGVKLWIPDITTNNRAGDAHLGVVICVCEPYKKYLADGTWEELHSDYQIGDIVIFGKYTGTEVTIGRDTFVIMFDSDVLSEWRGDLPDEAVANDDPNFESDESILRRERAALRSADTTSGRTGGLPLIHPDLGAD